mgnify:CR=1 FL=1
MSTNDLFMIRTFTIVNKKDLGSHMSLTLASARDDKIHITMKKTDIKVGGSMDLMFYNTHQTHGKDYAIVGHKTADDLHTYQLRQGGTAGYYLTDETSELDRLHPSQLAVDRSGIRAGFMLSAVTMPDVVSVIDN